VIHCLTGLVRMGESWAASVEQAGHTPRKCTLCVPVDRVMDAAGMIIEPDGK
jgi:hypothetical protein